MPKYRFSINTGDGISKHEVEAADQKAAHKIVELTNDIIHLICDRGLPPIETARALALLHDTPLFGVIIKADELISTEEAFDIMEGKVSI